ncbi:MAG: 30S ribosome-binding factor RbfA [Phycisphaerales bacterium]
MSTKHDRLTSSLEKGVQQVLARGLQDPRIRGLITVTRVEITPDGKQATVGISVLPAEHQKLTVHGLRSAGRHIRREVAELIRTRTMPELVFVEDDSLKKQAEVLGELARIRAEQDERDGADAQPPADEASHGDASGERQEGGTP